MKLFVGPALIAVAIAAAATWAVSAPTPSVIPTSWQLDIKLQAPQPIRVEVPGLGQKRTFWYVLYTVTNETGQDQLFVPVFTIYTDTGKIYHSGLDVPSTVFPAIKKRYNNILLQDNTAMSGPLLQGNDNAKEGVAIFPNIDPKARAFQLFVGGLSGETYILKLPVPVTVEQPDTEGNLHKVHATSIILHKTLDISYKLPGEAAARLANPPVQVSRKWIMR